MTIQKRNESPSKSEEEAQFELDTAFVEDPARTKRLRWKVDMKFLPLCAFIYLLNYLDRGNIGAAKIMNEETKDGEQPRPQKGLSNHIVVAWSLTWTETILSMPAVLETC